MTHIHVPDGVLPAWLWIAGWLCAVALVVVSARIAGDRARRKVPVMAVLAALMLVAMSSEIVPIAYHVNFSVVVGTLLGPVMSPIVAFIVVGFLAMLGHGGVTVIGLNTLVISAEMVLGWVLVRALVRVLGRRRIALAGGLATVVTLAVTTTLLVGLVAVAGLSATHRETGALDPGSLRFSDVLGEGIFAGPSAEGAHEEAEAGLGLARFALVVYGLGAIGWLLEALISAAVLGFVAKVRPGLVFDGPLQVGDHLSLPGDEHCGH